MKFEPHAHQDEIGDHQLTVDRGATWAGMGTGKTSRTLTSLQIVQDLVDPRPGLVLAPKRVASYTWPREMKKWDHLTGEVRPILGTAGERLSALRSGLRGGNVSLFSVNYENIPWLVSTLADLKVTWPFGSVIADEATRLKSFRLKQGGARAQALKEPAWLSSRFWELTGTPSPNGLKDLWGQLWFLDRGRRLGNSFSAYMRRWFVQDYSGFGWEPQPFADQQIHDRIRDICLSVEVPVDKPIVNEIKVELPGSVRQLYKTMEREAYLEIGPGIDAVHAAAKTNKLLQICAGAVYDEDKKVHEMHTAKIEALESVINEAGGAPVLVAINFQFEKAMLTRAFKGARVLDTDQDLDDWNAGKIPVGLAHPASLGHGIDLQHGGNIMVFYSGDWNLESHDQIIERIGPMRQKQSGYNRPVYLHYLLVENSIDEIVFARRQGKGSVQELLMQAAKRILS